MTADALLMNFGMFKYGHDYELMAALQDLVNYQKLRIVGNVYFPVGQLAKETTIMEVVPPRYQPKFKPLSTFLPKLSPRNQTIENRTFYTCTSRLAEKN
jgi:hypothetical protein